MIMISVTGQTYSMKQTLKSEGFQWNPKDKLWWKMVGVSLNATLEAIRPGIVTLNVKLSHVDASGNQISETVLRIKLKPDSEREGVDYYRLFNESICNQVIANDLIEAPSPLKSESKKDKKFIDEGFF